MPSGGLEFFYLFQKEMWLEIFLSFNLLREIGGLKGEVGRCAKWRSVGFLIFSERKMAGIIFTFYYLIFSER